MPKLMTPFRMLVASGTIVLGSVNGPTAHWPAPMVRAVETVLPATGGRPNEGIPTPRLAQTDIEEPLDQPIDSEDALDGPVQRTEDEVAAEPLDAPLVEAASDDSIAVAADPLDAPLEDDVIDQPEAETEVLDAPLTNETVAIAPVAEPVAAAAPVAPVAISAPVAKKVAEPVSDKGKPVTSVRKKAATPDRVVVVSGRRPLPAALAECDVAVGTGRATVGSDCGDVPAIAGFQPAIPRVQGSASLISAENPSLITSRRDGVQIGEYPEPTLGDSIATTVRAAIFPEDVIVPEILIAPGEVVVAGNTSREDPIVLWRSELEAAALETGIPVEMLATVIRATSNGNPLAETSTGGVGLMHVPSGELLARGIREDQWHDPATNIRIGAQLMAAGAAPTEVRSGAAVTRYLASSCGAGDACDPSITAQVDEWIVYYRLRATTGGGQPNASPDEIIQASGWPFTEDTEAAVADPLARVPGRDEVPQTSGIPAVSPLPDREPVEDEPAIDWNWPWSPDEG